jgi:endonuclease YncB( thermonuclease family)
MSRNWKYCSIAILVLAFVFFLNSNKVPEDALQDNKVAQTAMVVSIKSEKTASTLENKTGEKYEVVKVVDGDTMDVLINGKVERLRLIGINTPETVDPRKTVECFGLDASNRAKEIQAKKFSWKQISHRMSAINMAGSCDMFS